MNWDCEGLLQGESSLVLPCNFTSNLLAVYVASTNQRNTWFNAGYLEVFLTIDETIFYAESQRLKFGLQIIKCPYLNYKLRYTAKEWLENTIIKVKQLDSKDYLNMGINFQQVDKVTGPIVNTTVAGAVATFQVLPVDALRHEGTIYNQTNRTLYINWGTTAATTANLAVPAGSNIDIPEDYTGAVQGISLAGVTGNVLAQTISYV